MPALAASTAVRPVGAQTPEACAQAAEDTQVLRDAGNLLEARRRARVCQADVCPRPIRSDCERWLAQVEASTPTVVIRVEDASGRDRADVAVSLDGAPLVSPLDGFAVRVNPGKHLLVLRPKGQPELRQELLVAEGEKNRRVLIVLPPPAPDTKGNVRGDSDDRRPTSDALPWVFGGLAVIGFASFGYFGITALSKKNDIEGNCGRQHACPDSDRQSLFRSALAADISLGVGLGAAVVGTVLFLRAPSGSTMTVAPTKSGVAATYALRF